MGKAKTQRTEALLQAAKRYTVAKQARQAIEQHHFDKLVRTGLIVEEEKSHQQLRLNRHYENIDNVIIEATVGGGLRERRYPPRRRHRL